MEGEAAPTHGAPTDVHDAASGDEGKYSDCVIRTPDERKFGPTGIGEGGADIDRLLREKVELRRRLEGRG